MSWLWSCNWSGLWYHSSTSRDYYADLCHFMSCHYLCQIMSFNQDGSSHTETLHLRCFTKRLHFSIVEVETCRPSFCFYSPWLCCFRVEEEFFPCHQNWGCTKKSIYIWIENLSSNDSNGFTSFKINVLKQRFLILFLVKKRKKKNSQLPL